MSNYKHVGSRRLLKNCDTFRADDRAAMVGGNHRAESCATLVAATRCKRPGVTRFPSAPFVYCLLLCAMKNIQSHSALYAPLICIIYSKKKGEKKEIFKKTRAVLHLRNKYKHSGTIAANWIKPIGSKTFRGTSKISRQI